MNNYRNLIEALEGAPAHRPFVTAWVDEDDHETVTFQQFRDYARAQGRMLRNDGVSAGDRVIVVMPQGIAAMTVFVGAMMLGAVPTFLAYPNFKMEPSKYRSGLSGVTANLSAKVVVVDEAFQEEMLSYISLTDDTILLRAKAILPGNVASTAPLEFARPDDHCDSLAFIQHSAGTTGLQKAVALTHSSVLRQIHHLSLALKVNAEADCVYSWLPLYHDMGLIACFMLPMVCHLPVVMQSPIDWVMQPEAMLQIISEYKCTLGWMPNFAFQFVPRRTPAARWAQYNLTSMRALINCSEPVRSSSLQEFQKAFVNIGLRANALQSSYAMAENVFAVTQSDIGGPAGPEHVWADGRQFRTNHLILSVAEGSAESICFTSSGKLLDQNEVRIVSDSGQVLNEGHVGEIHIRSDSLFNGYYNRPDLSATALLDGWYHSGDLGFCFHGELFVVGRKKDLIIVGGENIYPQDIEEIIGNHTSIHDGRVVAMGLYNPDLGTDDICAVAEVEREEFLRDSSEIEREIRNLVVAGIGVAIRTIILKPPKWIVKSTAGKAARAATREKLLREHPELDLDPSRTELGMTSAEDSQLP